MHDEFQLLGAHFERVHLLTHEEAWPRLFALNSDAAAVGRVGILFRRAEAAAEEILIGVHLLDQIRRDPRQLRSIAKAVVLVGDGCKTAFTIDLRNRKIWRFYSANSSCIGEEPDCVKREPIVMVDRIVFSISLRAGVNLSDQRLDCFFQ